MSLTAFVVVALHGARTLLPPDSPELPLLVRPISPSGVLVPIPCVPCAPIFHIPTSLICPQFPLRPPSVPPSLVHPYPPCSHMSHVPQCPSVPPYPLLSPIPPCPPVFQCPLIPLCPLSPGVPHVPVYPHVSLVSPVSTSPSIPHASLSPTSLHVPTLHVPLPQDKSLSRASTFLRGRVEQLGTYGTAITAYALALVDTTPPGPHPAVERLRGMAQSAHGVSPWGSGIGLCHHGWLLDPSGPFFRFTLIQILQFCSSSNSSSYTSNSFLFKFLSFTFVLQILL